LTLRWHFNSFRAKPAWFQRPASSGPRPFRTMRRRTGARQARAGRRVGERLMTSVTMTVNGKAVTKDIEPRMLLSTFLREELGLTGTHVGCDTSQCGCCVVHVDGDSVKSCTALAVQFDGASVTTIEGLGQNGTLHPMQEAFRENHGLQCGFCTTGMIMSSVDLVKKAKEQGITIDEHYVREGLEGNICRCTGYHNIVKAVIAGAQAM
jgi:carbon-monoxide dehydrogenase small subunit